MKKILVNTGSNLSIMLVKIVVTFVMTPVLVSNLGNYDYGIWEILAAIVGYMGLLDFGMKPTIVRFSSKYLAENSPEDLRILYSTAWVFMFAVGGVVFLFFIGWAILWVDLLSVDADQQYRYSLLLILIGFQVFVSFPGYVAEGFLEGFQEFKRKNNISIFYLISTSAIVYALITPSNGIILLATVSAAGFFIKYLHFAVLLTSTTYGNLWPNPLRASITTFMNTARFGFKALVQGVAHTIESGTDTLVIGYFLGASIVPFYAIPANLINYIKNVGWTLTQAFMPLFTTMHAQNQIKELQEVYIGASRYVIALLMPVCVGATLLGGPFIGLWVGEQYQNEADLIILLLAIYVAYPLLNPFSVRYLIAIGAHGLLAKITTVGAIMNIALSIALVESWGIAGVALGSVIPTIIIMPVILKVCCDHLGISVVTYLNKSILPSIVPITLMGVCLYILRISWHLDSYSEIAFSVLIGAAIYTILFYTIGMSSSERTWLLSKIGGVRLAGIFRGRW